MQRKLFLEIL
jgi:hypothetical protein